MISSSPNPKALSFNAMTLEFRASIYEFVGDINIESIIDSEIVIKKQKFVSLKSYRSQAGLCPKMMPVMFSKFLSV